MEYVINASKLIDKLDKITQDKIIEDSLSIVGVYIEGQAKDNCPSNTGELRNSINSSVDKNTLTVGTNKEYAPYVEIGTGIWAGTSQYSPEYIGTGRQTKWSYKDDDGNWHTTIGQKPQPFLKPAIDNNLYNIQQLFNNKIDEELKKICQM